LLTFWTYTADVKTFVWALTETVDDDSDDDSDDDNGVQKALDARGQRGFWMLAK